MIFILIFNNSKKEAGNAQEESLILNRQVTIVVGCDATLVDSLGRSTSGHTGFSGMWFQRGLQL